MLEETATRYGAVETREEAERYANFLYQNRGKYDGVILSLPNFGDEFGAVMALKEAGVPILVQAYPDELDRMGPESRRDSFCGKISVMDVFNQFGVKFTALQPHVVDPCGPAFLANLDHFDRVCRVVGGMRGMVVGAIGARTTPFKTVRIDELALQRYGITVETLDLSSVIAQVEALAVDSPTYREKAAYLKEYSDWRGVPEKAFENMVRLFIVLEEIVAEYHMDAFSIRCWLELQQRLGISPCVVMSVFNDLMVPAACEVDTGSAVAMYALGLASGRPPALLDWNNNYGDELDKCILFHCGPVPGSLMTGKGQISDHLILLDTLGPGQSYGPNTGRITPMDFTYSSLMTRDGEIYTYLGQGRITADPIPANFFGVAGVAHIPNLQEVLLHVGVNGYRHHVSLTPGWVQTPLREALGHYLDFKVTVL
jgi:L-fucose isomerase-like protein